MERLINLSEIKQEKPVSKSLTFNEEDLKLPKEEVSSASTFTLKVKITKESIGYRVSGNIKGNLKLICARCGRPFSRRINENFSFDLMPSSTVENGMIKSDELDVRFYNDDILNLAEIAKEQILLSLPIKPLCGREPFPKSWGFPHGGQVFGNSAMEKLRIIKDKLNKRRENGSSEEKVIKHKKG